MKGQTFEFGFDFEKKRWAKNEKKNENLFGFDFEMSPGNRKTGEINVMIKTQCANVTNFRVRLPRRLPKMSGDFSAFCRHFVQIRPKQNTRPVNDIQMRNIASVFWNFLQKEKIFIN